MLIMSVNQILNFGSRDTMETRYKNLLLPSFLTDENAKFLGTGIGILEVYLIGFQSLHKLICYK